MEYEEDESFEPGEEEHNVYKESSRSSFVENDEMSPEEEAFMMGYNQADEEEKQEDE